MPEAQNKLDYVPWMKPASVDDLLSDAGGDLAMRREVAEAAKNREGGPMKVKAMLEPGAKMPSYAHAGDAGLDLYSAERVGIAPGDQEIIGTGVHLEIPEGYAGFVLSRSGLASEGIFVMNAPGLIDSGYRGEVGVILGNWGEEPIDIEKGDKIAQLLIMPVPHIEFLPVQELSETDRGSGGFGSTGF